MRPRSKFLLLAILPLLVSLGLIALAHAPAAAGPVARASARWSNRAYMAAKQHRVAQLRRRWRAALLAPLYDTRRDDAQTRHRGLARCWRRWTTASTATSSSTTPTGSNLMHPRQPELVGQNLWDLRDAAGRAGHPAS